jgi:DNA/RNA endonuclease YhcR with UshA esterase domain
MNLFLRLIPQNYANFNFGRLLIINEINYNNPNNPGQGRDTLEFIELYNAGATAVNVGGYFFREGVTATIPAGISIAANDYLVIAVDSVSLNALFPGLNALQWQSGGLSNSGEEITLVDNMGNVVDSVDYDDRAPWPEAADGDGPSLSLCDPMSDNLLAESWGPSTVSAGTFNGLAIFMTPGAANGPCPPPYYPIGTVTADANGDFEPDSLGVRCELRGVVYGIDYRGGNGLQFTLIDQTGGIGTFERDSSWGYTVTEGDSIHVWGSINQFRGLTQIALDTVVLISQGNSLNMPTMVSMLDESTESDLIPINGVTLVTPSQWPAPGNSANVDIDTGTDTLTMRIDSDTDVDDNVMAPVGSFDIIGIGGQFTFATPADDGYQIFPRTQADIITGSAPMGPTYYPIGTVTADANGDFEPDSLGVECELRGVVYGIDYRGGNGLQFTLIDQTGGIGTFERDSTWGYTVTEGDSVHVWGSISQFRGLTQIALDTVVLISQGNSLNMPTMVSMLDESTESELIRINGVTLVTPSQWPAAGASSNVDIDTGTDTLTMRIHSDTDVDGMPAPVGAFDVIGLGGQFTFSTPANDGYQIFPRYMPDIITATAPVNPYPPYPISLVNNDADMDGIGDSVGVACELRGVVHGVNLGGSNNVSFTIHDGTRGIGVFSSGNSIMYTVAEGDSVMIKGSLSAFRGVTQILPDSFMVISSGNALHPTGAVTELNEGTESELVTLTCVRFADTAQWGNGTGSGFNVDVTNNVDTFNIRINDDVPSLFNAPRPTGRWFNFTGIGGQFTFNNPPGDDGYQLVMHFDTDIVAQPDPEVDFAAVTMMDTVAEDVASVLIEVDVMNANPDTTTITMTITAASTATGGSDYTLGQTTTWEVTGCGDELVGVDLPIIDDTDSEPYEFIEFELSADNGATVTTNTYRIVIEDNDPIGIEGLLPAHAITAYPNPGNSSLNLEAGVAMEHVELTDLRGRSLMSMEAHAKNVKLNTSTLAAGTYILRVSTAEGSWTGRWVKQ